jgi:hypothetical protein
VQVLWQQPGIGRLIEALPKALCDWIIDFGNSG